MVSSDDWAVERSKPRRHVFFLQFSWSPESQTLKVIQGHWNFKIHLKVLNVDPVELKQQKILSFVPFPSIFLLPLLHLLIHFPSQTCGSLLPSSGQPEHQQRSSSRCVKLPAWMTSVIKGCFFSTLTHYMLCNHVVFDSLLIHTYLLLLFLAMEGVGASVHLILGGPVGAEQSGGGPGGSFSDVSQLCSENKHQNDWF